MGLEISEKAPAKYKFSACSARWSPQQKSRVENGHDGAVDLPTTFTLRPKRIQKTSPSEQIRVFAL